ncbi:unnamed protein product, partial [Polarella glacialis]
AMMPVLTHEEDLESEVSSSSRARCFPCWQRRQYKRSASRDNEEEEELTAPESDDSEETDEEENIFQKELRLKSELAKCEAVQKHDADRLHELKSTWDQRVQQIKEEMEELQGEAEDLEQEIEDLEHPEAAVGRRPGPRCLRFVDGQLFTVVSFMVILANVFLIFRELTDDSNARLYSELDNVFLLFYIVELSLRAMLCQKELLVGPISRVWWNWLDLTIVLAGILDQWLLPACSVSGSSSLDFFKYVRMLRVARVARILKIVSSRMQIFRGPKEKGSFASSASLICTDTGAHRFLFIYITQPQFLKMSDMRGLIIAGNKCDRDVARSNVDSYEPMKARLLAKDNAHSIDAPRTSALLSRLQAARRLMLRMMLLRLQHAEVHWMSHPGFKQEERKATPEISVNVTATAAEPHGFKEAADAQEAMAGLGLATEVQVLLHLLGKFVGEAKENLQKTLDKTENPYAPDTLGDTEEACPNGTLHLANF